MRLECARDIDSHDTVVVALAARAISRLEDEAKVANWEMLEHVVKELTQHTVYKTGLQRPGGLPRENKLSFQLFMTQGAETPRRGNNTMEAQVGLKQLERSPQHNVKICFEEDALTSMDILTEMREEAGHSSVRQGTKRALLAGSGPFNGVRAKPLSTNTTPTHPRFRGGMCRRPVAQSMDSLSVAWRRRGQRPDLL